MSLTTSPTKRQKVINEIQENVMKGVLAPGERLATVRDMSAYFNVSLSVIQNALRELMDNGFVECRGASGFYVKENTVAVPARTSVVSATRLYLSCAHHCDLVWRRKFDEYKKIREAQIKDSLRFSDTYRQYQWMIEQAEIVRVYLRDNPGDTERMQALFREERLELCGGFCIPDLNMVSGESILRNLLAGSQYIQEVFGKKPELACMNDAFGMCAQLPQMLKLADYRGLIPGRLPNKPENISGNAPFRWSGLDNSSVTVIPSTADVGHGGYEFNVPIIRQPENRLAQCISALKHLEGDAMVRYITEEDRLEEDLFWIIDAANRSGGKLIEFGRIIDYFETVEKTEMPIFYGEFNPTLTGCYTTRINVKQQIRQAENNLFAAEFINVVTGMNNCFDAQWHELFLAQFHDAVCGCHTDGAYREIMDKIHSVLGHTENSITSPSGKKFTVCNLNNIRSEQLIRASIVPKGVESQRDGEDIYFSAELPACGGKEFTVDSVPHNGKPGTPKFKTDYFEVDFSGPYPVICSLEGYDVFQAEGFGEILMRSDYGTMWTEKFMSGYRGRAYQEEKVTEIIDGPVFVKVTTIGRFLTCEPEQGNLGNFWTGFGTLNFKKEYMFPRHQDYFKLKLTLNWEGNSTKAFIRFPLKLKSSRLIESYEVPFGCVNRKPYFEVVQEYEATAKMLESGRDYEHALGDWPALNWVNYSDNRKGLTVANTGTPGHQMVNGDIIISLLRSGNDIKDGRMVPQPGSYDNGTHEYEFAFRPHAPLAMEKAYELGQVLNRPPVICGDNGLTGSWLELNASNIGISALYRRDDHVVIRLYETIGRPVGTVLSGKLINDNLYECKADGSEIKKIDHSVITFRPFEIRTFLLKNI